MPDAKALICVSSTGSKYAWLNNTLDITLNVPQRAAADAINRYPINLVDKHSPSSRITCCTILKQKGCQEKNNRTQKRGFPSFPFFMCKINGLPHLFAADCHIILHQILHLFICRRKFVGKPQGFL